MLRVMNDDFSKGYLTQSHRYQRFTLESYTHTHTFSLVTHLPPPYPRPSSSALFIPSLQALAPLKVNLVLFLPLLRTKWNSATISSGCGTFDLRSGSALVALMNKDIDYLCILFPLHCCPPNANSWTLRPYSLLLGVEQHCKDVSVRTASSCPARLVQRCTAFRLSKPPSNSPTSYSSGYFSMMRLNFSICSTCSSVICS